MKKRFIKKRYLIVISSVFFTSCVSDDLPDIGDSIDLTAPTPFYNITDITTSQFDCNDMELSVDYNINFQAGSNLAVNGTQYEWSVEPFEGVTLLNKDIPIIERSIDGELASVIAIEEQIEALELRIPCEENADRISSFEAQITSLEQALVDAEASISEESRAIVADLEAQITMLPAATLQDRELIFSFPGPGDYLVSLTVTDNLGKSESTERTISVIPAVPTIPVPEIAEASFEDNSIFDGSGDGRDSWRTPSNDDWSPVGAGTTVIQINTTSVEGRLPDGFQSAKFPADGTRVAYQEIDVTPGAEYVLTYFSEFQEESFGDITVSILNPETSTFTEAQMAANIIASRTDNNVGRVADVFRQHAIPFEAGDNESIIIFVTNSGVESRLDAFAITVQQ